MLCLKEHSERRSRGKRLHYDPYWKAPCRSQRSCYLANLPSQGHWTLLVLNCLNVHAKRRTHYCFSNGFQKNLKSSSQRVQIVSPSKGELVFLVDAWNRSACEGPAGYRALIPKEHDSPGHRGSRFHTLSSQSRPPTDTVQHIVGWKILIIPGFDL